MQLMSEDHLPHVTSSVERFLVNPAGTTEGMVLLNGVEVQFPPRLFAAVNTAVHVGDRVTVYGVLRTSAPLIAAVVIEAADGKRIVDVQGVRDVR